MGETHTAGGSPRELAAALVDALAALDPAGMGAGELAELLTGMDRELGRVRAQWLRHLATFDARGDASAVGGVSTTAWLRRTCRVDAREASRQVALARSLRELPETRTAAEDGDITVGHAAAIHQASRKLGLDRVREVEATLVDAARRVRPGELRRLTQHLQHTLAPEASVEEASEKRTRRWLSVSTTFDGMVALDGLLDPESGASVLEAVNALSAPTDSQDQRSPAHRRADALSSLCRRALDTGALPRAGGQRPHLTVAVAWETLAGAAGAPAAHLNRAGPIPAETARRLGCDAQLTRIITGPTTGRDANHTAPAGPSSPRPGQPGGTDDHGSSDRDGRRGRRDSTEPTPPASAGQPAGPATVAAARDPAVPEDPPPKDPPTRPAPPGDPPTAGRSEPPGAPGPGAAPALEPPTPN